MTSKITVEVPDALADRLGSLGDRLPQVLELGLRELNATGQSGFRGAADVLEALASLPSPEEILTLRPSESFQARVGELLDKNRSEGLSAPEEQEWEAYQYLEHLVRLAKAKAHAKLKAV